MKTRVSKMLENMDEELKEFEIQTPGGQLRPFSDVGALKDFAESQYPDWKATGKITAIPEARVPKVFLHDNEMSAPLFKKYCEMPNKGELAEMTVFRELLNLKNSREGILIFPNVNGNEWFAKPHAAKILRFEIDLLLVHPTKGVFIFNTKSRQSGKEAMKKDFENHCQFIRCLMTCAGSNVPIHKVMCNVNSEPNFKWMKKIQKTENWFFSDELGEILRFQKPDFEYFSDKFWPSLEYVPPLIKNSEGLDVLVYRLIALSSIEGATALIHNKLVSGQLQAKIMSQAKMDNFVDLQLKDKEIETTEQTKQKYKESLEPHCSGNKVKVILWTKEQLRIIVRVLDAVFLSNSDTRPKLKLFVRGSKGSGKTMLMLYIKEMISRIIENNENDFGVKKSQVKVCDGSAGSSRLFFKSLSLKPEDFVALSWPDRDIKQLISDFADQTSGVRLLLVDEMSNDVANYLSKVDLNFHCVIFSSDATIELPEQAGFQTCELTASLRATREITEFCERFRQCCLNCGTNYPCIPGHNLYGNKPVIVPVDETNKVVEECIKFFRQCYLAAESTLVVSFTTTQIENHIKENLQAKTVAFCDAQEDFRLESSVIKKQSVVFARGRDVDGCEFANVIILVSNGFQQQSHFDYEQDLYVAMTRATTRLHVISVHSTKVDKNSVHRNFPETEICQESIQGHIDAKLGNTDHSLSSSKQISASIGNETIKTDKTPSAENFRDSKIFVDYLDRENNTTSLSENKFLKNKESLDAYLRTKTGDKSNSAETFPNNFPNCVDYSDKECQETDMKSLRERDFSNNEILVASPNTQSRETVDKSLTTETFPDVSKNYAGLVSEGKGTDKQLQSENNLLANKETLDAYKCMPSQKTDDKSLSVDGFSNKGNVIRTLPDNESHQNFETSEKMILNALAIGEGNVLVLGKFPTNLIELSATRESVIFDEISGKVHIYTTNSGTRRIFSIFNGDTVKLIELILKHEIKIIAHLGRTHNDHRLFWATKSLLVDLGPMKEISNLKHFVDGKHLAIERILEFFENYPRCVYSNRMLYPKEDIDFLVQTSEYKEKLSNPELRDIRDLIGQWIFWYQKANECYKQKLYSLSLALYKDCFSIIILSYAATKDEALFAHLEDVVARMRQVYVAIANRIRKNMSIFYIEELEKVLVEALNLPDYSCEFEPENVCYSCLRAHISNAILFSFWEEVLTDKKKKAEHLESQNQQESVLKHTVKTELRHGGIENIGQLVFQENEQQNEELKTERERVEHVFENRTALAALCGVSAVFGCINMEEIDDDDSDRILDQFISICLLSHASLSFDPFSATFYDISIECIRICRLLMLLLIRLKASKSFEQLISVLYEFQNNAD